MAVGSVQMAAIICRAVIRPVTATATLCVCHSRQTSVLGGRVPFIAGRLASTYRTSLGQARDKSAKEEQKQKLIWEGYKRRHKGQIAPKKTRLRCRRNVAKGISGNPCPICANNIEIEAKDVALLNQFICPHSGKILQPSKTGLCHLQQKKLLAAITKAWDYEHTTLAANPYFSLTCAGQKRRLLFCPHEY